MKAASFHIRFSKTEFDQLQENGLKEGILKMIRSEFPTETIDNVQVSLTPESDNGVFVDVVFSYEPSLLNFRLTDVCYKFAEPQPEPEPEPEEEDEEDKPMYLSDAVQNVIHDCDLPLKLAFIQKFAPEVYWRYSGRLSDYINEMYMDAVNEEWTDWDALEDEED